MLEICEDLRFLGLFRPGENLKNMISQRLSAQRATSTTKFVRGRKVPIVFSYVEMRFFLITALNYDTVIGQARIFERLCQGFLRINSVSLFQNLN